MTSRYTKYNSTGLEAKLNQSGDLPGNLRERPLNETDVPLAQETDSLVAPQNLQETGWIPDQAKPSSSTTESSEPWYKKTAVKVGAIALVAAAGVATVAGLMLPKENGRAIPDASSEPVASAPATPGQETTAPATTETNPGTIEFKGEVVEQTHTIAEMDAIKDLNEFAHLPYADRFAYALAKNPQLATTTPDNDFGYTDPSSIPPYFWQSISGTAISDGNTLEGAKIISALQYYGTDLSTNKMSAAYKAASDSVLQNGGEGVRLVSNDVYVDSGKWQSGIDREGNPIDYINVTDKIMDNDSGTETRGEVTNQAIRQLVKLSNGKIYVTYPQGYGVYGKKSPVDGGTY